MRELIEAKGFELLYLPPLARPQRHREGVLEDQGAATASRSTRL
jgi:hypothetical protein